MFHRHIAYHLQNNLNQYRVMFFNKFMAILMVVFAIAWNFSLKAIRFSSIKPFHLVFRTDLIVPFLFILGPNCIAPSSLLLKKTPNVTGYWVQLYLDNAAFFINLFASCAVIGATFKSLANHDLKPRSKSFLQP